MSSRFSSSRRSSVMDRMRNLSVVEEEAPVNEFGQITLTTPPRPNLTRQKNSRKTVPLLQSFSPGPVPLAGMVLPPSPPESPGMFECNVQTTSLLFNQPRSETPPYSDEDECESSSSECTTPSNESSFPSFLTANVPRPAARASRTDFAPTFSKDRSPMYGWSLPASGGRRTSSPPTLEQITQRLKEVKQHLHQQPNVVRRSSEPPLSITSAPGLPSPARAETLPSRLPKFLLNRRQAPPASTSVLPPPLARPRMHIQEIPTFSITPPPEREERSLALKAALRRTSLRKEEEDRHQAGERVERRKSTGGMLERPGGLKVPGL